MTTRDRSTVEEVLTGFDEHLRRTRGVCPGTRRNYARFVRAFLQTMFPVGPVEVAQIHPRDVVEFVGGLSGRYRPRTVELAASSLRSFSGFCARPGCVTTGWTTRSRWCRIARPVLFVIWARDASSS
ncbi:MAG: site-specific integrase [Pseudonocardiaceae bacterium]